MRRIVVALLFTVVASARFASAAAISVAGAECGTPPLGSLTFTAPASGSNLLLVTTTNGTVACPALSQGQTLGDFGFGAIVVNGTPLYGNTITSLDVAITGVSDVALLNQSLFPNIPFAFATIDSVGNGEFRLSGGTGIQISCPLTTADSLRCAPLDALILFNDFAPGTVFTVTAVNGISTVPEPATSALLLAGFSAAFVRRRVRRRRNRNSRPTLEQ